MRSTHEGDDMTDTNYEDLLRDLYDERDKELKLHIREAAMLHGIEAFLLGIPWEVLNRTSGAEIRDTVLNMIRKVEE